MAHYLNDVEYIICENQGSIFEQISRTYTYDTFVQFIPAFLESAFCKCEWDTDYSPFQYNLVDDNLDFILPELKKKMKFVRAQNDSQIFDPNVAYWLGFTYRQLFILTKIPSSELSILYPTAYLCATYPGLHTVDEDRAGEILVNAKDLLDKEKAYAKA